MEESHVQDLVDAAQTVNNLISQTQDELSRLSANIDTQINTANAQVDSNDDQDTFIDTVNLIDDDDMKTFAKQIEANFDMQQIRELFQPNPTQNNDEDITQHNSDNATTMFKTDDDNTNNDQTKHNNNIEDMKQLFMQNIEDKKAENKNDEVDDVDIMEQLEFKEKSKIKDIFLKTRNCCLNYMIINEKYLEKECNGCYPLLLIHGLFDSRKTWNLLLPKLTSYQNSIICVNLNGFGDSQQYDTDLCACRMDDYLNDLVDLLNVLHISKAVWIGHDLGSFIVQNAAIEYEAMVHKMILIAPNYTLPKEIKMDILREKINEEKLQNVNHKNKEFIEDIMSIESKKCDDEVLNKTMQSMKEFNGLNYFKYIKFPVYIFVGSKDTIFNVENSYKINKCIKSSFIMEFPQGNHYLIWNKAIISRLAIIIWDFCRQ